MAADRSQYPAGFVAGLEWMWGEGFLSPGGAGEVEALLEGVSLDGLRVLDIGSGLGGVDLLLAEHHGARQVIGIDVEQPLVDRARAAARKASLEDRVSFQCVVPGPLPFADQAFDVVFSKDSIIHIPDKPALYRDVKRVLRPGGCFVASDWLYGGAAELSQPMREWLELVHLDFALARPEAVARALEDAGFDDVRLRDRNAWYRESIKDELARISGDAFEQLAATLGRDVAEQRLRSSTAKQLVVDSGELRPCHLFARKPG